MLTTRAHRALTLVEILIVLAIVAALAALLYPAVAVQLRRGQGAAVATQLQGLREAISNYHENVQRYPSVLTQLTTQPVAGALDICGAAVPANLRNQWRGPYLAQNITGNFPVGDATVQNVLTYTVTAAPVADLGIVLASVDSTTAADIEQQYDGQPFNYAAGSIRWVSTGGTVGNLTYRIPIRGC